jgi:hypothetical protein
MTDLLKKAFDAASRLPENEQDAVAEWLFAELAAEEEWEERLAGTQGAFCPCSHGKHLRNTKEARRKS